MFYTDDPKMIKANRERGERFKKKVNKISQSVFGVNVYSSSKS